MAKRTYLGVRITTDLRTDIEREAAINGETLSAVIERRLLSGASAEGLAPTYVRGFSREALNELQGFFHSMSEESFTELGEDIATPPQPVDEYYDEDEGDEEYSIEITGAAWNKLANAAHLCGTFDDEISVRDLASRAILYALINNPVTEPTDFLSQFISGKPKGINNWIPPEEPEEPEDDTSSDK